MKLTAKGDLKGVKIDDSLMKPAEKEILEDLLVAAHADARRKAEAVMQEKMKAVTGGLPLPPGLNLFGCMTLMREAVNRHARLDAGHPSFCEDDAMAGTSPAMTRLDHAHRRRRTRNRAPDPAAGAAAGPWARARRGARRCISSRSANS